MPRIKYLTPSEASRKLENKLKSKFKLKSDNDWKLAAEAVFGDGSREHIKLLQNAIERPEIYYNYVPIWRYVNLKLTPMFKLT